MNREERRKTESIGRKLALDAKDDPDAAKNWMTTQLQWAFKDLEARFPGCDLSIFIIDRETPEQFHHATNGTMESCRRAAAVFAGAEATDG